MLRLLARIDRLEEALVNLADRIELIETKLQNPDLSDERWIRLDETLARLQQRVVEINVKIGELELMVEKLRAAY